MYIQSLEKFDDERGSLFPYSFTSFIPRRLFIVSDVPKGERRGGHAHYETEQFLICLRGSIEVFLHDGKREVSKILEPMQGIHIPNLMWDSQIFKTGDDLLLVLASTDYDRKDYIESMPVFMELTK